jgi:hypothetical protein
MWTKPTADIKCPRGDCLHYSKAPDELPCRACTCNQRSNSICRHFAYQPKGASYDRNRTEPPVLGKTPEG